MRSLFYYRHFAAILLLFATISMAQAQAPPAWQTAVAMFGTGSEGGIALVEATAGDATGNVYVVGILSGSVNFSGIILTSGPATDMFIAKWSSASGRFIWAQRAGAMGAMSQLNAFAVAVSGANVYITGRFTGTVRIGNTNLTSAGSFDVFVAKIIDAGVTGSFAWAQRAGGTSDDIAYSIAARGSDVYVTGSFYSTTAIFGSTVLTTTFATGAFFLVKLNDAGSTGSFTWAQQGVGAIAQVAVSGTSVYITGSFSGVAYFGSIRLSGYNDAFVAKLTDTGPTGNFLWAQRIGGKDNDYASSVVVNGADVYVAGTFTGTVNFGTTVLSSAALGHVNFATIFLTKLTDSGSAGNYVWAKQVGGLIDERGPLLAVEGSAVYMAGNFQVSIIFDSTTLTCTTNQVIDADIFIAKLVDLGGNNSFVWAKKAGGLSGDHTSGIVVSGGRIFICGIIEPPASFDNIVISQSSGYSFLASLTDPTLTATTAALNPESPALYPNPAHAAVTVQLPAILGVTTATLTMLDALGRVLRTQTATTNARANFDLTGLPAGIYALRVTAGPQTVTRRLVVE